MARTKKDNARTKKKNRLNSKRRRALAAKRKRQAVRRAAEPQPELGTPAFAKLQALWYSKLKKQGFDDLEWVDNRSGYGQDSPHLKHTVRITDAFRAEKTAFYFRLWDNWYTWNSRRIKERKDRMLLELFKSGASYRSICKELRSAGFKRHISLFWVFKRLRHYKEQVIAWNKQDQEGLLYSGRISELAYQVKGLP